MVRGIELNQIPSYDAGQPSLCDAGGCVAFAMTADQGGVLVTDTKTDQLIRQMLVAEFHAASRLIERPDDFERVENLLGITNRPGVNFSDGETRAAGLYLASRAITTGRLALLGEIVARSDLRDLNTLRTMHFS